MTTERMTWTDDDLVFHTDNEVHKTAVTKSESSDTYVAPEGAKNAAKRALEWIADGKAGGGFTSVGRKRASDLANGHAMSFETVKRIKAYFDRHQVDKKATGFNSGEEGYPSPGRVAWDAWGGNAAWSWATSIVERHNKKEESAKKSLTALIAEAREIIKYSQAQERDSHGRFGSGDGSEVSEVHQAILSGLSRKELENKYTFNPDFKKIDSAVSHWTQSKDASTEMRNVIELLQQGKSVEKFDTHTVEAAKELMKLLGNAPVINAEVYRGMLLNKKDAESFLAQVYNGTVDIGVSSFTTAQNVAETFSGARFFEAPNEELNTILNGRTSVMITVEPGSRGVDISNVSDLHYEKEVVSGGRYTVLQDRIGEHGIHYIRLKQVQ